VRVIVVTGTDTGVGKTILAAAIVAALRERGSRVGAFKPVLTGTDEPAGDWPRDHELLASVAGASPDEVAPLRFGPPVSPHLAAELAGKTIDPRELVRSARAAGDGADVLVVEGVGGLLVPLTPEFAVRDLAAALGLPLVVAARPGLGTINHTLLTVESARAAGLDVRAVVLTPWPPAPSEMERSNAGTIARETGIGVAGLPQVKSPDAESLAVAARGLPVETWVGDAIPVSDRPRG
jgi:dethiobiotin synthetase